MFKLDKTKLKTGAHGLEVSKRWVPVCFVETYFCGLAVGIWDVLLMASRGATSGGFRLLLDVVNRND